MRILSPRPAPTDWPRPPSCLTASQLRLPSDGARVAVAGLVILRQRPGTAKGVIFLTLEDETGTVNIIVWRKLYERFRRAVIAGRMLRVTGRIQNEGDVIHVIAEVIEDISPLLDQLLAPAPEPDPPEALSPEAQTG
ncbi:MAG: OB-fold nucleic acid binding domain-containing protein [Marivita sp.]|uniref:OB-fold nucleic acid binding domain-containing protein n=1 Tax=Marivita sp. TaxID=2003365 RepID=UPI003EF63C65